jgi:hypothetical protein
VLGYDLDSYGSVHNLVAFSCEGYCLLRTHERQGRFWLNEQLQASQEGLLCGVRNIQSKNKTFGNKKWVALALFSFSCYNGYGTSWVYRTGWFHE